MITERKDHLELLAERFSKFCKDVIVLQGGMNSRGAKAAITALDACGENEAAIEAYQYAWLFP